MKKYLFIFKSEVMSNIGYVFNIISSFIGYAIMVFIFLNLWKYMYSDPSELINGYSMNSMVWYVIITEIIWGTVNGRKLCIKISDDVKSGNIAYNINKPYNYIGYALASHLGGALIRALVYIVLFLTIGYIFLGTFPHLTLLQILGVLLSLVLAVVISTLLIITIGLCSFIIEDSVPLYWLYSKFILVLGVIFPIEFFPKSIRPILQYTPIQAVSYGPAKLFVDFSSDKFIEIIISQIVYLLISYSLASLLYKKGVKRLNVNGG